MISGMDVMIALKIAAQGTEPWGQVRIAKELGISQSSVHEALRKLAKSGLYMTHRRRINVLMLHEFLGHSTRYLFPAEPGALTRGVPTAWGITEWQPRILSSDSQPVWPHDEGHMVGVALAPIHPQVPFAALADPKFHRIMAYVDAFRFGMARERALASDLLHEAFFGAARLELNA